MYQQWARLFFASLGAAVFFGGVAVAPWLLAPVITSQAVQAPEMSLDVVTSGNSYSDATNTMTVGSIDNCLMTDPPGNNAQHNHTAHLIIQHVEDLIGWQARLNYDGGRMRPSTVNFTPFVDNTTGQNVSFLNLPLEARAHRGLITATNIPPHLAGPQTALLGSVYNGSQSFAVSPDTPAKSLPDDTSYNAPFGGVLAAINLQVQAGQAIQPSLYIDLDDGDPNAPGSAINVFTGSGIMTLTLTESLGDGFHGEGVPCVPVVPVPPPAPPPPTGGGAGASSPSADSDGDGFSDTAENTIGTYPLQPCGADAWPSDINNSVYADTADIAFLTSNFGLAVPPTPARHDLAPSGYIDTADIARITSVFGQGCPSSELLTQAPGATTSRYVSDLTFNNDCNADYLTMFSYGRDQALRAQQGIVILDFAGQINVDGVWGVRDWKGAFHPNTHIANCAAKGFIDGFGTWSFPGQELHLGIGTNNSLSVDAAAGQSWATLINDVNLYIDSTGFGNLLATGANDFEPGYSSSAAARAWTIGYDASANYRYYDYGSADGCPYTETSTPGEDQPCWPGWYQSDVEWVSWGDDWAFPLPEIYLTDWINAWQWQKISVYAYYNDAPYDELEFTATLTQYEACQQQGCAPGVDNTAAEGWRQLQWAVNTDARTDVIISKASDILWDS